MVRGSISYLNNERDLTIFHIDMDAFYAAVEEEDNPKLKGKPVIVGGRKRHGIVTTANYEARKFGVHSAMPIFMARQKCPHGHYVPNRKERYDEVSTQVFEVLDTFTELIEQVSIDEAYLDISEVEGNPIDIAEMLKGEVKKKTGLTLSVGISYNKFLAKLASDWNKPDGITVISRDMVPEILLPLKVSKIHGIGPKTKDKLNNIGIYEVRDLYNLSEDFLLESFGKQGEEIYNRVRGIDNRKINIKRERKSLGTERTFETTTKDIDVLSDYLLMFSKEVADGLKSRDVYGRTVSLKVKYDDFIVRTRSRTLVNNTNDQEEIYKIALELLDEIKINRKIRLIGLTASNLTDRDIEQLSIF